MRLFTTALLLAALLLQHNSTTTAAQLVLHLSSHKQIITPGLQAKEKVTAYQWRAMNHSITTSSLPLLGIWGCLALLRKMPHQQRVAGTAHSTLCHLQLCGALITARWNDNMDICQQQMSTRLAHRVV